MANSIVQPSLKELKDNAVIEIDRISTEISTLSKSIFNNPETGFNEYFAQKEIVRYLREKGVDVKKGVGKLSTSLKASVSSHTNGFHIAFLAEYDALPGLGHACGHNIIAGAGVAAFTGMRPVLKFLPGMVSIIGTPAEEGGGGKILMLKAGAFEGVDAAMMIHPSNKNKTVRKMLALTELTFTFSGKAAHAAANPENGINALDAVILTFNNINALRQQIRDDARIHGIIIEGGTLPNIIPDRASCRFFVRSAELSYFYKLVESVKQCARAAETATGASCGIHTSDLVYKPFLPNYKMASLFKKNLASLGIKEEEDSESDGMGSSDIGNISNEMPTIHADICICRDNIECHTPAFAQAAASETAEKGMIAGAKAMALTAIDILASQRNIEEINKEFSSKQKNIKYNISS